MALDFRQVVFVTSVRDFAQLPPDEGAEVAFAGRSNAGKSSTLNAITGVRQLARVSKTPGRTQMLNFFAWPQQPLRLVDLPGYGYAEVPAAAKREWERTLNEYLHRRRSLAGVVLIVDARHALSPLDAAFCEWCAAAALPLHVLLNKADKLAHGAAMRAEQTLAHAISALHAGASAQLFSATAGLGRDRAQGIIAGLLRSKLEIKKAPETRGENPGPGSSRF